MSLSSSSNKTKLSLWFSEEAILATQKGKRKERKNPNLEISQTKKLIKATLFSESKDEQRATLLLKFCSEKWVGFCLCKDCNFWVEIRKKYDKWKSGVTLSYCFIRYSSDLISEKEKWLQGFTSQYIEKNVGVLKGIYFLNC